ncbi:MAG: STAS domain-containing protein [Rhodomicrobium sp.]
MKVAARPRTKALSLPANLDMRNAQDLKDSLMAALERNPVLQVNGSKTNHVATPGVQVLLAASKTAMSEGGRLVLSNPSDALQVAFHDLGLSEEMRDWGMSDV